MINIHSSFGLKGRSSRPSLSRKSGNASKSQSPRKSWLPVCTGMTLNSQGFTVVGAVVLSTIGLIALTGMSKQAALIAQQQQQVNKERDLRTFWIQLETETDCKKTIKNWLDNTATDDQKTALAKGSPANDIAIKKIQTKTGTLLDISTDSSENYTNPNNVFSRYGFSPRFFALRCKPNDASKNVSNGGSCDCRSSATPTPAYPCKKKWVLIPGVQDGMTFIKGEILGLELEWKEAPTSTLSNFNTAFECSKLSLEGKELAQVDCLMAKDSTSKNRTLVGCGSTKNISARETIALGYDVLKEGTIGAPPTVQSAGNTFIGSYAGSKATVYGEHNTFIGPYSGEKVTVYYSTYSTTDIGEGNVFVGYKAGPKTIGAGDRNHFFGPFSGKESELGGADPDGRRRTASDNTFIGYESGPYIDQEYSLHKSTFIGDRAGENMKLRDRSTYIAGETVYIRGNGDKSIKLIGARDCGEGGYLQGFEPSGGAICKSRCQSFQVWGRTDAFGEETCVNRCHRSEWWDGSRQQCVSSCSSDSTWDMRQNRCVRRCQRHQSWDGARCVNRCPNHQRWNGSQCVNRCTSSQRWDGTKCVEVHCPDVYQNFDGSRCYSRCFNVQQKWNGTKCVNRCSDNQQKWNGTRCVDRCPNRQWSPFTKSCLTCWSGTFWTGSYCQAHCVNSLRYKWNGTRCVERCPSPDEYWVRGGLYRQHCAGCNRVSTHRGCERRKCPPDEYWNLRERRCNGCNRLDLFSMWSWGCKQVKCPSPYEYWSNDDNRCVSCSIDAPILGCKARPSPPSGGGGHQFGGGPPTGPPGGGP